MDTSTPLIKPLSRIYQPCGIPNSKPTMWDGFYNSLMVKGTVYCCFLVQFPPYTDVGNTPCCMDDQDHQESGERQMGRNFRQTMNVVKRCKTVKPKVIIPHLPSFA